MALAKSKSKSMTPKMKQLLRDLADGADPNLYMQIMRFAGKRREKSTAQTMLALYDRGYLVRVPGHGLQVSDAGRAAVQGRTAGKQGVLRSRTPRLEQVVVEDK